MEKFIMADGCALRVRDSGEGSQTLVLLHGYLESIEVWEDFIPLLKGVRVIAPDLPGHGISQVMGPVHSMDFLARTVHAAVEGLGVEKYFIAGHSMGGYVALEMLRLFPNSIEGIVLIHSTPYPDTDEKREQREREIEIVQGGRKDTLAHVSASAKFAAENRKRLAGIIEDLSDEVTLLEDDGIVALLRGMAARRDNTDTLRSSGAPQLFILGRADEYISVDIAEKMIADQPQAKVLWLEHSGHMGFIEEPHTTAEALLSFMSSASS